MDWIKIRIKKTHNIEDDYNKELGLIDKQVLALKNER